MRLMVLFLLFVASWSPMIVDLDTPAILDTVPAMPEIVEYRSNHNSSPIVLGYLPYWISSSYTPDWDRLTHLGWFSIELDNQGLVTNRHGWPDTGLVDEAHANGVKVHLVFTQFSSSDIHDLIQNYPAQAIQTIRDELVAGNADGVNIDFEMPTTNGDYTLFADFIRDLNSTLKAENASWEVSIAGPSVDWWGTWDYSRLSNDSDFLMIMAYGYHWSGSSTTGAISPLYSGSYNIDRSVNDYISGGADPAKVVVGLPWYGREWPCTSDQPGASTTASGPAVIYSSAVSNAATHGRNWHDASSSAYYAYQSGSQWYQGWYDDPESIGIKLDYIVNRSLGGMGIWALGYEGSGSEMWDVIEDRLLNASDLPPLAGVHVAVDPGHGGGDRGFVNGTSDEAGVALSIGAHLRELLEAEGATVTMTRSSDADIAAGDRVTAANSAGADYFVTIHTANSTSSRATTYHYPGSVEGTPLAGSIQASLAANLVVMDNGTDSASWAELSTTSMPAVWVEVGSVGNESDRIFLTDEGGRYQVARAIFEGLLGHVGETAEDGDLDLPGLMRIEQRVNTTTGGNSTISIYTLDLVLDGAVNWSLVGSSLFLSARTNHTTLSSQGSMVGLAPVTTVNWTSSYHPGLVQVDLHGPSQAYQVSEWSQGNEFHLEVSFVSSQIANQPPIFTDPGPIVLDEDQATTPLAVIDLDSVFSDDNGSITYAALSGVQITSSINGTWLELAQVTADWSGSENISIRATDDQGLSASWDLQVHVHPLDDAPRWTRIAGTTPVGSTQVPGITPPSYSSSIQLVEDDLFQFSLDTTDVFDPEGDPVEFSLLLPSFGSFSGDEAGGVVDLAPDQQDVGNHTATVLAIASGQMTPVEIEIEVLPSNDPPSITSVASLEGTLVYENGSRVRLVATATDPDSSLLTFSWSSDLQGTLGTGPEIDEILSSGNHTITVTVDDGELSDSATITIYVLHQAAPSPGDNSDIQQTEAGPEGTFVYVLGGMVIVLAIILLLVIRGKRPGELD